MRILFVSNLYPPNVVGGYERLCHEVASAFVARGHDVAVLTSCYGGVPAVHPGQVVHQALQLLVEGDIYAPFTGSAARREVLSRANIGAARRVVAGFRPDAIFCWNMFGLDRSLLDFLVEKTGVPAHLMLTDNWLLQMANPDFLGRYMQDQLSPRHVALPAVSNGRVTLPASAIFGAGFMRDLYHAGGLAFARETVVHNGVRQPSRNPATIRDRAIPIETGVIRLLVAGRNVELKGVHTAIEALGYLDRRYMLTIVGERPGVAYGDRLAALARAHGCTDRVDYREPVAESALFDLFQEHDIYLFPSLYEPFSLTLIHALAAGIPTVASRVGGNTEIVHDGETGILFDAHDAAGLARAIESVAADPVLRTRLSQRGRAESASFGFERMIGQMDQIIAGRDELALAG